MLSASTLVDLRGVTFAAAAGVTGDFFSAAGDFDLVAVGVLAGAGAGDLAVVDAGELEAILVDLRGVTFAAAAAAGVTRPAFLAFEGAALGDFLEDADAAAVAGDVSFAETGAFDTPPLTADLGVFAGDFFSAAGDFDLVAVGVLAGAGAGDLAVVDAGELEAILVDLRGVTFAAAAAAGVTRPAFFAFEGAALGDFLEDADAAAVAGDVSFAETGAFDTPPLTADLGVFAGDFFSAAGDFEEILLNFPGLTFGDFTLSLPF